MKNDANRKMCDYPSTKRYDDLHRTIKESSIGDAVISWHVNSRVYSSFVNNVVSIVSIGEKWNDALRDELDTKIDTINYFKTHNNIRFGNDDEG